MNGIPDYQYRIPHHLSGIRNISSVKLVNEMKSGWNLGNTFDASFNIFSENSQITENIEKWETAWGNPIVTKELIDKVKEAGFNILRIPITWSGSIIKDVISIKSLERIKEVVDYGIENDMFVIINMHHDDKLYQIEDDKDYQNFFKIWKQIAFYFKDYNEKLIFEDMNEPRYINHETEWIGGTEYARNKINELHEEFVYTIRHSYGFNKYRHLMIPTYAAATTDDVMESLVIPKDDKIIVSLHAYLPYLLSLAGPEYTHRKWVTRWNIEDIENTGTIAVDKVLDSIKRIFIDKGIPVIIGEYGVRDRDNLEDRIACAKYYASQAKKIGIPMCWWDNGVFEGDDTVIRLGLIDRNTLEWKFPEIVKAITT